MSADIWRSELVAYGFAILNVLGTAAALAWGWRRGLFGAPRDTFSTNHEPPCVPGGARRTAMDPNRPDDLHEYPGGIQERPGGSIPLFLKLTYVGFTLFGIAYFALYRAGDGSALVRVLNAATGNAP